MRQGRQQQEPTEAIQGRLNAAPERAVGIPSLQVREDVKLHFEASFNKPLIIERSWPCQLFCYLSLTAALVRKWLETAGKLFKTISPPEITRSGYSRFFRLWVGSPLTAIRSAGAPGRRVPRRGKP